MCVNVKSEGKQNMQVKLQQVMKGINSSMLWGDAICTVTKDMDTYIPRVQNRPKCVAMPIHTRSASNSVSPCRNEQPL